MGIFKAIQKNRNLWTSILFEKGNLPGAFLKVIVDGKLFFQVGGIDNPTKFLETDHVYG